MFHNSKQLWNKIPNILKMMDIKQLGERLKIAREKLGINPRQFSMKAKVDPSQYNKTEAGNKGLGNKKIMDICSTWNINPDWLFTGKGDILTKAEFSKNKIED